MNIEFNTSSLEKLCNNTKKLIKKFGSETAQNIKERLDSMRAATVLEDLRHAPGDYHDLKYDKSQQIGVSINKSDRIVFESIDDPLPLLPDNASLDWSKITKVKIMEITNYHKSN